ncbi:alpha-d-galacturonidase [Mucilaginibacter lacusdianchii]|uniref:alpha-d-galacturonidase n=1 Tax=Mucilaginibacter lacusdianchii TaxID=2684211 RepID=UPI00131B2329|nr:glycoside hydrolase family 20 zincin-like fold domain-containing protein [Mucilaginibacter sp. JXJ CY 39]
MAKLTKGCIIACLYCLLSNFYQADAKPAAQPVNIVLSKASHARVTYGAQKLAAVLGKHGYTANIMYQPAASTKGISITVGTLQDAWLKAALNKNKIKVSRQPGKEGFALQSANNNIVIAGADNSGALYGCLELADQVQAKGKLPVNLQLTDQPEMVMRGACIGVQKPFLLPGRGTYEYPYTPESFPWFYDKALWLRYLDSLAQNRMNSLYLWNGHPFASLVRVKDYPEAVEVDDATFKKNEDIYRFIANEADKRGIWLVQGFYNIIVPKPFAEKHNLVTQDRNRHIIPIISDYTRKSIAAFVEKYPNVGLLITLGEAMEGVGQDDVDWFTKTIIPGVKDGLKALGRTDEPPIVLRAHDSDAPTVMKYAMPLYKNLYTMAKYNGEALTTYTPHGSWADLHRTLSRIGTVQIENVHILANLEPFRYGSADFIQKCVQAMHSEYEANGLHLYPQASYWDWPYTADSANQRLFQLDRDWIWYKEWSRYAWNCHRDRAGEIAYWGNQLAARYGCTPQQGKAILEAYEQSGEISPQILRRVGITDGNRQTMTLGMLMSQFVNPEKYGLFSLLYTSEAPVGEILSDYAEKEWKHEQHVGETPIDVASNVPLYGKKAVEAINQATAGVTRNADEFKRLKNDMYCYNAMANSYSAKIKAAVHVLRYKYSNNVADLENALPEMESSLAYFKQLVNLTKDTYLYANSMQTKQRKIPVGGNDAKMKTWIELLPVYQKELDNFKKNLDSLKLPATKAKQAQKIQFTNADVKVLSGTEGFYTWNAGEQPYADTAAVIQNFGPELKGLKGIKLSKAKQVSDGATIKFSNSKPVKVLVGFYTQKSGPYLQPPQLETDASANDFGQADIKMANAALIPGMPPVNIHTYTFKPGTNTLSLGKGACLVLGFIDDAQPVPIYDAGLSATGNIKDLRWLFN